MSIDPRRPLSSTLELWEPEGALERLERWLRERGFFAPGGERLVADLYLGYGLSQALRRERAPAPPEPLRLPLVACSVRRDGYVVAHDNTGSETVGRDGAARVDRANGVATVGADSDAGARVPRPRAGRRDGDDGGYVVGTWEHSWTAAEYMAAVERVRAAIASGDVYQVNLVQHLSAPFAGDPGALAARLAELHPAVAMPYRGRGWTIVSASPELFLSRRGRRVRTMPIKGTRPLGGEDDLRSSAKDAAEHVMIVDLERNDLSRVCEAGSVRWPELMAAHELAGVAHLVSTVEGRLREGVGLAALLAATFPGGSITGAPKIAAIDHIAAIEPVGRGASMGALGWVRGDGDLELALTIRTFAVADGRVHLWVGGGVVWDSDPVEEVEESWTKARPLLAAIGAPLSQAVAR